MNTQILSRQNGGFLYRRMALVAISVTLALAAFTNGASPANSTTTPTGTLTGTVIGTTGSGTPVPVGVPADESVWTWHWPGGCVHGPGYWREKPERWPAGFPAGYKIGGKDYTKAQLLAIMSSPGGAANNLIFHLVAAMINRIYGQNYDGLDQAIDAANNWLQNQVGVVPVQELENFNYGHRGHVHCNDVTNLPDLYTYFCQVPKNNRPACASGYYKSVYEWHVNKWGEVSNSEICMTQAECQPVNPNLTHNTLPCEPFVTAEGLMVYCAPNSGIETNEVSGTVDTTCPVNEVIRAPYPRALVNNNTNYFLQPNPYDNEAGYSSEPTSPENLALFIDASGNPSKLGFNAGIWKNLVITMRTRRFNGGETWLGQIATPPQWVFADRSWNAGMTVQTGVTANYTYKTSSAGLATTGGRGYDFVRQRPSDTYNLPAYNVDITTSCGHEWKAAVDVSQRGAWVRDGSCSNIPMEFPPGWVPDGYSTEGCKSGWYAPGHYTYSWSRYTTGWAAIDMTLTGLSTTYDQQTMAKGGGTVFGFQYWDAPNGIRVPVVEVQSVLRDPCVAAGTCQAPAAESGSVTQ